MTRGEPSWRRCRGRSSDSPSSRRTFSTSRAWMPAGTRVVLRTHRRGDRAELVVEDDGPGIPARHKDAVFERFYRVEGGMASGSGLGLAIAREIARLMGGVVRLDSTHDPTVFTVDLPGEPSPAEAPSFSRGN